MSSAIRRLSTCDLLGTYYSTSANLRSSLLVIRDISYLLNSFLTEMERNGKVDFRASGVAPGFFSPHLLMKPAS